MAADVVVSRELQSLRAELSVPRREQKEAAAISPSEPANPVEPAEETPEERELLEQLNQLVSEVTGFFDEAEKNIAAHPTQSVVGALLVGILIGRMLGRR
ncbi:hypothetical protein SAZ10_19980 [Mesorhizobium sp. BAC0120]|uniref:hypothetical protein n=1 Tax=Mesorhizobium sp. BAC0120 TaxID=3090670 RepID=UPI00298CD0D0|nr:hypothetical protein [Mesorhizobium sp. BAC0120]MDW6024030.1 hypothetical protein [Mesorhizobium sp. BAC0120]